jgi:UDP-2,3-diacylglucosamine pyrophosphatase LpxH
MAAPGESARRFRALFISDVHLGTRGCQAERHVAADGRRYHVTHGDHFDLVVRHARCLAVLGHHAYRLALVLNIAFNGVQRQLGLPYRSLSRWAKLKVKSAVNYIGAFESMLAIEAGRHQADGVICGHIHHPMIRDFDGVQYINCGDWVEHCSAAIEHFDGRFELVRWGRDVRGTARGAERIEAKAA